MFTRSEVDDIINRMFNDLDVTLQGSGKSKWERVVMTDGAALLVARVKEEVARRDSLKPKSASKTL